MIRSDDTLTVEIPPGTQIGYAIKQLIIAAKRSECQVRAEFNNCWLVAQPTSTFNEVAQQFDDYCAEGAAEREAARIRDARLLAAAPALLAACKALLDDWHAHGGSAITRAHAAIAQAEGKS